MLSCDLVDGIEVSWIQSCFLRSHDLGDSLDVNVLKCQMGIILYCYGCHSDQENRLQNLSCTLMVNNSY